MLTFLKRLISPLRLRPYPEVPSLSGKQYPVDYMNAHLERIHEIRGHNLRVIRYWGRLVDLGLCMAGLAFLATVLAIYVDVL